MPAVPDIYFMQRAYELACQAQKMNEVPVGAVVVSENTIVGEGFNQPISLNDPAAHAEIIALRQAGNHLKNYRLTGCSLFVTLEPCAMCAVAMIHARIKRLIFATPDPKTGACGSCLNLCDHPPFNHRIRAESGVMQLECQQLLRHFFAQRR